MAKKLPSQYIELEYIESNGSQYIDTGVSGNNVNLKIITDYETTSARQGCIFAARESAQSGISYWTDGYMQFGTSSIQVSGVSFGRHIIEFSKEGAYLDGDRLDYNSGNLFVDFNLLIYKANADARTFIGRIYSFKIYDNNSLVRDFVPCKQKVYNTIGMYDLVNDKFYINEGTGTFIAGPEIPQEEIVETPDSIDWSESMQQTFEYYEVDPNTWKDKKLLDFVKSSSINRDSGTETLGSASIDIDNTLGECYIRIYLVASQNGVKEKVPLGIFLVQTPSSSFDGKVRTVSMDAYTPLLELKEKPTPLGYALLKDDNIMEQAYMIVRENCRAPVVKTESDKLLQSNFVANNGDTWLTFVRDLIAQAKFELQLDEEGKIMFAPKQTVDELQPVYTYNDDNSSILLPEVSLKHDIYGIPNVVEVVCSTGTEVYYAQVKNEDPNSPTSIQARGREIIYRDTSPNLPGFPTREQIDEYAENLLKTLNSVEYQISYSHGYCPVRVGDCVRLNYTKAGLIGIKAKVISQNIKCDSGCTVSETAIFTKNLWKER